jgi:hypothetical protein
VRVHTGSDALIHRCITGHKEQRLSSETSQMFLNVFSTELSGNPLTRTQLALHQPSAGHRGCASPAKRLWVGPEGSMVGLCQPVQGSMIVQDGAGPRDHARSSGQRDCARCRAA